MHRYRITLRARACCRAVDCACTLCRREECLRLAAGNGEGGTRLLQLLLQHGADLHIGGEEVRAFVTDVISPILIVKKIVKISWWPQNHQKCIWSYADLPGFLEHPAGRLAGRGMSLELPE